MVTMVGVGAVVGTIDIAVPAFAQQHDQASVAGVLLATVSAGSAVGGLLYGRRRWTRSARVRLLVLAAGISMVAAALAAAQLPLVLGRLLAVLGLLAAPATVTGYLVADELAQAGAETEASSWVNSAMNTGLTASAALAGLLIQHVGISAAFAACAAFAGLCAVVGGLRLVGVAEAPQRLPVPQTSYPRDADVALGC